MSKFESANNFIKSIKQEFKSCWNGEDNESFCDGKFYVDKTCICAITDEAVFISSHTLFPKSALYISEIAKLAGNLNLPIFYIPQWQYFDERHHEFTKDGIINAFQESCKKLKDKKDIYSKQELSEILATMQQIDIKLFKIPESLLNDAANSLKIMEEAISVHDKKLKEFIETHSYYELTQYAYFLPNVETTFRTALKRYLNPSGEFAFLRIDYETQRIYSSECYCGEHKDVMSFEEGYAIGTAYLKGIAKHGQKYGRYTVMKVMDGYIQISCNKYTRKTMEAAVERLENFAYKVQGYTNISMSE